MNDVVVIDNASGVAVLDWTAVKAAWAEAKKYEWQAVEQAARVGQLLIELQGDLKQAEFVQRAEQELGIGKTHIFSMMKIAKNLPMLEKKQPRSQREALKFVKEDAPKREAKKAAKVAPPAPVPADSASIESAAPATHIDIRLSTAEFGFICKCLLDKRVPQELKAKFNKAYGILSLFGPSA